MQNKTRSHTSEGPLPTHSMSSLHPKSWRCEGGGGGEGKSPSEDPHSAKGMSKINHIRNVLIFFKGGGGVRSKIQKSYKECLNIN